VSVPSLTPGTGAGEGSRLAFRLESCMRARVLICFVALVVGMISGSTPAGAQARTGSITGTVVAPDGAPLEEVCVEAFSDTGSGYAAAQTRSDGSYVLEELAAGDYHVGFNTCGERVPGYAGEFYDDARTLETSEHVTVSQGETVTGISASLEETGSFSGAVVEDGTGDPLEGICVLAFDDELGSFGEATTDADGGYVVADLPAGAYTVVFGDCAEPYVHISEVYDDVQLSSEGPETDAQPVDVTSGEDTGGIDASLAEGGAVQGVLTGLHTGEEQPLVCVGLFDAQDEEGRPVALADSGLAPAPNREASSPGEFVFPGVVPGDYVVAFNPGDCADTGYLTSWYDDALSRDDADILTVTQGEVTRGIDAVVVPQPSIDFACPFELEGEPDRFSDVPEGNVHRRAIECLALFEVVLGRSDGTYAPAAAVTRAQLASFVARTIEAAGVTLPADPPDAFDDDNGSVHEATINQLAAAGVVNGKGGRRYAPAETVNRAQMATFLVNAYEAATGIPLRSSGDRFPDDDGNVHESSIDKAATAGITAGTGSGYAPNGVVRRDAMASFLARLLDRAQRDLAFFLPDEGGGEGEGLASMSVGRSAPEREPAVGSLERLVRDAARG
jgi:hypothetical protein